MSSFLSGIAPNLETLVLMRVFQGLGGGPVIPMSQAILWEIFPLHQRGLAMAMWGVGIMMGPIFGPTVGGWIADNWSWRWIFYINLPIGLLGFLLAGAFLIDSPHLRKPGRIDVVGPRRSWCWASAACSSRSTGASARTGSTPGYRQPGRGGGVRAGGLRAGAS